jgi:hypothetical protein
MALRVECENVLKKHKYHNPVVPVIEQRYNHYKMAYLKRVKLAFPCCSQQGFFY